jgi:hypothetical protein
MQVVEVNNACCAEKSRHMFALGKDSKSRQDRSNYSFGTYSGGESITEITLNF